MAANFMAGSTAAAGVTAEARRAAGYPTLMRNRHGVGGVPQESSRPFG